MWQRCRRLDILIITQFVGALVQKGCAPTDIPIIRSEFDLGIWFSDFSSSEGFYSLPTGTYASGNDGTKSWKCNATIVDTDLTGSTQLRILSTAESL
jgi:hypothetical protein